MNTQVLHDLSFFLMYACLVVALFISIERLIFYRYTNKHARELDAMLLGEGRTLDDLTQHLESNDSVPADALRALAKARADAHSREDMEQLSAALYLAMKSKLKQRLWMLDTIVTAAPLIGLLGTILGIIDTFSSLAASGISDAKGVSAGIGTALYATALGISTALFVLVFLNHFNDRIERIGDHLKILLLRAGIQPGSQDNVVRLQRQA
ncbi:MULTISPECIES: MotA/TolQ/ExbB proton channel family protein [Pandoraea]|uniref:Biopolymer transporter ExbB n=1 Tax=Pandoraea norimbergensis TaxID=93219 RepID=A0ABM5WGC5_9BURK|nr:MULTISPECIES: MotA/TolQ/ExbB proton channel family protein [Pandoraea]ALS59347.1 biopolymer transporter ExbB [Pandoraea norimbergensis]